MTNKFQLASHTQESESLKDIHVSAYRIPTPAPESDGSLRWDYTTMVLVELQAGDKTGIGYTYAHPAAASLIHSVLTPALSGENVFDIPRLHRKMTRLIRNIGTTGLAMMAVSAVDIALWDIKARLLNLPLVQLLGKARERILIYGSGGFTSYTRKEMQEEIEHWLALGLRQVKMKVGRYPADDPCRVQLAREFIGDNASLFVDANGAYDVKQALKMASAFAGYEVEWFEEPVPSSDLPGLRLLRSRIPDGMRIAAGEYGFNPWYFQNMLSSDSVDVLQADATRCGGITGFLAAGQLAHAFQIPFSSHCAPAIHLAAAASLPSFFTAEYFIDHVRIESELLEGTSVPRDGYLVPDETAPGHGLAFRHSDAEQHKIA